MRVLEQGRWPAVSRATSDDEETPSVAKAAPFRHSSRHADLESLLADHILDPEAAAATAKWFPSRRGNSPRSAPKRK
jgi:hypothetical protein